MENLQDALGYRFRDPSLLHTALSHSSYANERRSGKRGSPHIRSNERLEFLGDAILNTVTADYLYRSFPEMPEGDLTRLRAAVVCEEALHREALSIGLSRHLLLGRGEDLSGGRERPSILADAVEAVIGAIYLDGGWEPARAFILSFTRSNVAAAAGHGQSGDYKTMLQEIVQKNREETLSYRLADAEGPDHEKSFTVELLLNSNVFATGTGHSKKAAEQDAARAALRLMGYEA
ncbi:MAG: ribonuclease III [Clostridiaceae bacterium]|nr:ribonuclease III [Clostridiales bacterium]MDD6876243.1 ribonuclease III [Clostridiaceae bacterium]MDY3071761.1 ribonuclease III [Eubacteriales bacterium]MDY3285076.1 ribonuclease III [Eubacteriales bacterium]MDY5016422.1 ribonuclease III [Eubacteriales bacterium]